MRHIFEVIQLWEQQTEDLLQFPGLLPLAVLGRSDNRTQTLREISSVISTIENRRQQSNIAAATSILAGLVLEKDVDRTSLLKLKLNHSKRYLYLYTYYTYVRPENHLNLLTTFDYILYHAMGVASIVSIRFKVCKYDTV